MFRNLYKQNININERQEIRRKQLLQQQKSKRLEHQDERRQFEEFHEKNRKSRFYHKKHKNTELENIQLQLSEWLRDRPENVDDWLLVPCPKGQRCLVVSGKGETKMFSKNKRYRSTFCSLLPGGGLIGTATDSCILDCIYNKEVDTFYVLDALHFSITLVNCEAEFRFFWMKSKFDELDDMEERYKHENMKSFQLLEYYDMSNEAGLAMALQRYPFWSDNQPELDGFLFYHKESHYICGSTPLVCWLFPFMVPDVLQIPVSNFYKSPENYCKQNPWQYMDEFDKEMMKKYSKQKYKQVDNVEECDISSELDLTITMEEDCECMDDRIDDINEVRSSPRLDDLTESLSKAERLIELEGNS